MSQPPYSAVTEHLEIPAQAGPEAAASLGSQGPGDLDGTGGTSWYRRRWVQVLATGLVCLGIGAASGSSSAADAEARAVAAIERADEAEAVAADAKHAATETRKEADADVAQAEADATAAIAQGLVDAKAAVAADRAAVTKSKADAEAAAKKQTDELNARSAALDAREAKVSGMEAEAKANEFGGDGIYAVGSDIKPGTYKADPSPTGNCYYARLSSLDGNFDNIIDNNNTSGPVVVQVRSSDAALEVNGCSTFRKVG